MLILHMAAHVSLGALDWDVEDCSAYCKRVEQYLA